MPSPDKPIYFIQEHLHREVFHGGISNVDIERIFTRRNYRAIQMPCRYNFSMLSKVRRLLYLLKIFFTLPAGSRVLFQFPLYARMDNKLISLLAKKKKSPRFVSSQILTGCAITTPNCFAPKPGF